MKKYNNRTLLSFVILIVVAFGFRTAYGNDLTVTGDLFVHEDVSIDGSLVVGGDDGVVFGGTAGVGLIPYEGTGPRMMWYPAKRAFRAGGILDTHTHDGDQWDDQNVGYYSTAFGQDTIASGNASFAAGGLSKATGWNSVAMGRAEALGDYAIAIGGDAEALDGYAVSIGNLSTAAGGGSYALGSWVLSDGYRSVTLGGNSWAKTDFSIAIGHGLLAEAYGSFVVGHWNVGGHMDGGDTAWKDEDPLFEIGNGTGSTDRSNALTVYKSGAAEFSGPVRVQPAGDLSMGDYTAVPE